jgi:hypothetical protein
MAQLISLKIAKSQRTSRSPEHDRFDSLLRQIERARALLAAWRENQAQFRKSYAERVIPAQAQLNAGKREWLIALDGIFDRKGWTKTERLTLDHVIRVLSLELMSTLGADEELRRIYTRHSDVSLEEEQARELDIARTMAERMTGVDLGDEEILDEEALYAKVREAMSEREQAAREQQEAHERTRKKSAAEKKREADAALASQSIREIYRRLASNLHPDRETDPERRARKNELMQRVNQAYEAADLLTLLEIQLEIDQIDAQALANSSIERVRQYNRVLADQLREAKQELTAMEDMFRVEFGIESRINPHRLLVHIDAILASVRGEIDGLKRDLAMLNNRQMVKQWLRWELQRASSWSDRDYL